MKRSEILEEIKDILRMNLVDDCKVEELSEALLFTIERAGMLPPARKDKKLIYAKNREELDYLKSIKNKWEPED